MAAVIGLGCERDCSWWFFSDFQSRGGGVGGGVKAGQLEVEVELYLWAAAGALPPLALH